MDNETPQYAEWIPTAGGYVANGNVVSKSPHYDENKNFQLSVNPAVFGQTTPENSKITKAKPQVANNPLSNNGITTANTEGSGTDANAVATGIGSLDSMTNNTATTGGVLTTPATQSTLAKTPKSVYDTLLDKYAQYQANNNYKGMIDTLTEMSMYDGQDYTQQQQYLNQQRNNKIDNIDNDYSQRIATAQMLGDIDTANALKTEQAQWRNSVGWSDAMTEKYQTAQQQLETDYIPTYLDGIRDITSMITQAIPGLINFQYDPYQDASLQIAQGYAVSKVKEQMNSTGMYYSSMTQNAITKAAAELVPVYQKMAKEEAMQNLQLLQQTANFLLNIEETQFKLWQGQLDAKIAVNQEKRKEIEAAWDRVNQLGYVDNEASAILAIPAGTESYATRKAMTDLLNEKDAEKRSLEQSKALERYQTDMAKEKARLEEELKEKYYLYQINHPDTTSSTTYQYVIDSDGNVKQTITSDKPLEQKEGKLYTPEGQEIATTSSPNKLVREGIDFTKTPSGKTNLSDIKKNLEDSASQENFNITSLVDSFETAYESAKNWDDLYSAIKQAEVKAAGQTYKVFDTELLDSLGDTKEEKLENYYKYLSAIEAVANDPTQNIYELFNSLGEANVISEDIRDKFISGYTKNVLLSDVNFTGDENQNLATLNSIMEEIAPNLSYLRKEQIEEIYKTLFDEIIDSGTKSAPFDFVKSESRAKGDEAIVAAKTLGDFFNMRFSINDTGDKSKQQAIIYTIVNLAGKNGKTSPIQNTITRDYVVKALTKYLYDKSQDMKDGYSALKYKDSYNIDWSDING